MYVFDTIFSADTAESTDFNICERRLQTTGYNYLQYITYRFSNKSRPTSRAQVSDKPLPTTAFCISISDTIQIDFHQNSLQSFLAPHWSHLNCRALGIICSQGKANLSGREMSQTQYPRVYDGITIDRLHVNVKKLFKQSGNSQNNLAKLKICSSNPAPSIVEKLQCFQ